MNLVGEKVEREHLRSERTCRRKFLYQHGLVSRSENLASYKFVKFRNLIDEMKKQWIEKIFNKFWKFFLVKISESSRPVKFWDFSVRNFNLAASSFYLSLDDLFDLILWKNKAKSNREK